MLIFQGSMPTNVSPEEMQASMGKWMAWIDRLREKDQYVSGEPLLPGGKLVSGKAGKNVVDGPFTEGKEVIGGFFIIRAKDINEAVAISKDCPDFELPDCDERKVHVRQVMRMEVPA